MQRTRGLAGSGKTIVLALKAAYLHASHPEWRIAVTFLTRSLKEHFRRLITYFTIEQTGEGPDWKYLRVIHRDMTTEGSKRPGNRDANLNDLLEDLESGKVHLEDLDDETIARFKKILGEKR